MAESPDIEDRVGALERDTAALHVEIQRHDERLAAHEERITAHGRENDELREAMIREETENRHREDSMRRVETKVDEMSGKVDSILMKPAQKWETVAMNVVLAVVSGVVVFMLAQLGFK